MKKSMSLLLVIATKEAKGWPPLSITISACLVNTARRRPLLTTELWVLGDHSWPLLTTELGVLGDHGGAFCSHLEVNRGHKWNTVLLPRLEHEDKES